MTYTTIIIIITVIISLMAWQNIKLYNRLIFYPPAVRDGQFERLLTHGFIHADGWHLLFNMFVLFSFGRAMESFYNQYVGGYGFIVFYLMAIIAAILPDYNNKKNHIGYRSLGASGGVSAVLFGYILMYPWNKLYFFGVLPIPAIVFAVGYICYSVYADRKGGSNINHSAHLWGAGFGVVATIAIEPNVIPVFFYRFLNP